MSELPPGFEVQQGALPEGFEVLAPQSSLKQELTGAPKQIGAGLIESAASIPGATPSLLKQVGNAVSGATGLPEPTPIINPPPPPEAQLSAALPAPQNEFEAGLRQAGQVIPQIGLAKGHWAENLVGGIGAAAGAHYGPQAAPYLGLSPTEGAIGGAILGGMAGAHGAGNIANAVTRGAMPKPEEVLAASRDGYDALRDANRQIVLPRDAMRIIKNGALDLLRQQGPAEESAKEVYSIFRGLDSDRGGTVADLINARKNLKGHFEGNPSANQPAAVIGMQVIDAMLGKVAAPGTLDKLKELDTNWSAARTAQSVNTKISQAEAGNVAANSGLNEGNKILQAINSYVKSRTDPFGKVHLAPSDLEALQSVKPGAGPRIERFIKGIGGGGGGMGLTNAMIGGGLGAAGLNQLGVSAVDEKSDPILGGLGLPMLGLGAGYLFNRGIARAAKNAEAQILGRAPYMQGVALPRAILSAPQVAGRSLLFAAPAMRDSLVSDAQ
jgi:hypothetical protein